MPFIETVHGIWEQLQGGRYAGRADWVYAVWGENINQPWSAIWSRSWAQNYPGRRLRDAAMLARDGGRTNQAGIRSLTWVEINQPRGIENEVQLDVFLCLPVQEYIRQQDTESFNQLLETLADECTDAILREQLIRRLRTVERVEALLSEFRGDDVEGISRHVRYIIDQVNPVLSR